MNNIVFEILKNKVGQFQYFTDNQITKIVEESKL
jgi:hypothetical protein